MVTRITGVYFLVNRPSLTDESLIVTAHAERPVLDISVSASHHPPPTSVIYI